MLVATAWGAADLAQSGDWLGPSSAVLGADGQSLYVTCTEGRRLLRLARSTGELLRECRLPNAPTGLALSPDGTVLVVTCSGPDQSVAVLDPQSCCVVRQWSCGSGPCAPVFDAAGDHLFVSLRFENVIVSLDLRDGRELVRAAVPREPVAAVLTPDRKQLAVANLLPGDFAAPNTAAAAVSVLDVATLSIRTNLLLPPGSVGPRALAMSPDGRWCAVPHQLARFRTPTTQVRHGWMNINAVSLIDLAAPTVRATLILDEADRGAANPWAAAWSADGESLCITHTGTQELSFLDTAALLERLAGRMAAGVIEDFGFLHGIRRRLRLETTGPRALVLDGQMAYVAGYFSDTVSAVNLDSGKEVRSIELGASDRAEVRRRGMSLFHDGRIGLTPTFSLPTFAG